MLAVLLVSGVASAQTVLTDTPEIAALRVKANAGDASAQFYLGGMYRLGQGVPQDYVESHKWRNLAASRVAHPSPDKPLRCEDHVDATFGIPQGLSLERYQNIASTG